MLRSVIENYLTSTKELQFILPFLQLLELIGYYDIHLTHGGTEFGKDVIAKNIIDGAETQFSFQLKVGNVDSVRFRNEIQPQLLQAQTNKLSHPNFDTRLPYRVVFVTTGNLVQPATLAFQAFNNYLENTLKVNRIATWEKEKLITDFLNTGLSPFFALHRSPELISRFFQFYSQILNDESIGFFEIEAYTKQWLTLDWSKTINRLQIYFESYFFSKLLLDKNKHYESALIVAALVRILLRHIQYNNHRMIIQRYFDEIALSYFSILKTKYDSKKPFMVDDDRVFAIFYHPLSCFRTLELLSLYILTSPNENNEIANFLFKILDEQNGSYRVLSDNYAISIVLISLVLIKLKDIRRLRRFLNNVCVWLCDRYENIGISHVGSTQQEELEQLLSEYLTGLSSQKNTLSFAASVLLDIAYLLKDKLLYEQIANDLRATEIIPEFYHVLNDDSLFIHNHPEIVTSTDNEFSIEFKDNYNRMIDYERKANAVSLRDKALLFLMFLLRDRYFPTFITEIIG